MIQLSFKKIKSIESYTYNPHIIHLTSCVRYVKLKRLNTRNMPNVSIYLTTREWSAMSRLLEAEKKLNEDLSMSGFLRLLVRRKAGLELDPGQIGQLHGDIFNKLEGIRLAISKLENMIEGKS